MLGVLASTIVIHSANADTRDPNINRHQRHQGERIANGVKSGELTKDEVRDLRGDRKSLRQEERAYKADGKLTREERMDLRQDSRENSRKIYREKHDAEKRP